MRRCAVPGVVLGLLLSPAASAGLALPEPTCDYPEPSFGVHIDEEARALGALDNIYVDGAVAVPVRLGLGMSNLAKPSDLVDRGLANLDVAGPDGVALAGKLEIAVGNISTAGEGQAGWLIWVGEQPFEPNTIYELQYSFVNDKISTCPQAVPTSGALPFTTGVGSAAEQLAGVNLTFASASLFVQVGAEIGCCSAPDATPCITQDKCVACWDSYAFISQAQAQVLVAPPVPISYFVLDLSLAAGETEQLNVAQTDIGYASFSVTDSVPEYCFSADLRPRAASDAKISASQCVTADSALQATGAGTLTALPAAACAEPPVLTNAGASDVLLAVFGSTEQEAQAALQATHPQPGQPPILTTTAVTEQRSDCSVGAGAAKGSTLPWLVALLLLASRRRGS